MQRRIGLAQALINDPELILLDEPTSGLDPIGTAEIKELIRDLREQGKTIVLSGHLLADMQDICDRIAILHRGELKELGKVSDLLTVQDVTQIKARDLPEAALDEIRDGDRPPRRRADGRSTTRRRPWRSCSSGSSARATCTRAAARSRPTPAASTAADRRGAGGLGGRQVLKRGAVDARTRSGLARPGRPIAPARGSARTVPARGRAQRTPKSSIAFFVISTVRRRPMTSGDGLARLRIRGPRSGPSTARHRGVISLMSAFLSWPILWRRRPRPRRRPRCRQRLRDLLFWFFLSASRGLDPRPAGGHADLAEGRRACSPARLGRLLAVDGRPRANRRRRQVVRLLRTRGVGSDSRRRAGQRPCAAAEDHGVHRRCDPLDVAARVPRRAALFIWAVVGIERTIRRLGRATDYLVTARRPGGVRGAGSASASPWSGTRSSPVLAADAKTTWQDGVVYGARLGMTYMGYVVFLRVAWLFLGELFAVRGRRLYSIARVSLDRGESARCGRPGSCIVVFGLVLAFTHWFLQPPRRRRAEPAVRRHADAALLDPADRDGRRS